MTWSRNQGCRRVRSKGLFQQFDALGRGFGQLHLLGIERAEDRHLAAGAGHGHVQASLTTPPIERTEVQREPARRSAVGTCSDDRSEGDRDHHHVALVPLHTLQISDDQIASSSMSTGQSAVIALISSAIFFEASSVGIAVCRAIIFIMSPCTLILPPMNACIAPAAS